MERVRIDKEEEQKKVSGVSIKDDAGSDEEPIGGEPVETVDSYFTRCNARVDKLLSALPTGDEMERVLERARTDDVYLAALETRMPVHNVRVPRLSVGVDHEDANVVRREAGTGRRVPQLGDDSSDGEMDDTYFSREQLKKKSSELIDSKSKKRAGKNRNTKRKRF